MAMGMRPSGLIVLALPVFAGCGWVDGTGRQDNAEPTISEDLGGAWTEDRTLFWPATAFDRDGNLVRFEAELLAEGSAVVSCLSSLDPIALAPDLRAACQPALDDEACRVRFEPVASGVRVHVPALRRPAALQYQVSVTDADGASDDREIDLCIDSVAEVPRAVDDSYSLAYGDMLEHSGTRFDELCRALDGSGVLANDSDDFDYREVQDSGPGCLQARLVDAPAAAAAFSLALDGGFSYRGDGSLGPGGRDRFTYLANDGLNDSEAVTVEIAITGENRPPVAQVVRVSGDEDQSVSIPIADLGSDPEGTALRVQSVSTPSVGRVVLDDEALIFGPPENFVGSTGFDAELVDAGGASATATVTVTIREVNDLPLMRGLPESLRIDGGQSAAEREIALQLSDEETEAARLFIDSELDGSAVGVRIVQSDADGEARLFLEPLRDGAATLQLILIDESVADLPANRRRYSLPITVVGMNRAPSAVDDDFDGVAKNRASRLEVLANDSDADGDLMRIAELVQVPANGSATISADGSALVYQPQTGFSGADSLRYRVEDGRGGSSEASVSVKVINQAPEVLDENRSEDRFRVVSLDVLANDSDPDGDPLSLSLGETVGEASVALLADNRVRVSVGDFFVGTVVVNYTVADDDGGETPGTATIAFDLDTP